MRAENLSMSSTTMCNGFKFCPSKISLICSLTCLQQEKQNISIHSGHYSKWTIMRVLKWVLWTTDVTFLLKVPAGLKNRSLPWRKKRTKRKRNENRESLLVLNHIRYILFSQKIRAGAEIIAATLSWHYFYTLVSFLLCKGWWIGSHNPRHSHQCGMFFFFFFFFTPPQYYVLVASQWRNLPWTELLFSLHSSCLHLGKAGCYDRLKCLNSLFLSLICNKVLVHWLSWLYGSKLIDGII